MNYFSLSKMEAVGSSEIPVTFYQVMRLRIAAESKCVMIYRVLSRDGYEVGTGFRLIRRV
jgi:hypothetical protein